jgi:succinyl-CoA synthetase beta subunit
MQANPQELRAEKFGMNHVWLDGDIACLANGHGAAMGTRDVIKLAGGTSANLLDLGGGQRGFIVISSNPKVKIFLVKIFGGIVKCEHDRRQLINVVKKVTLNTRLVVRLEGTNIELEKKIFAESELKIIPASNITAAGEKAVAAAHVYEP